MEEKKYPKIEEEDGYGTFTAAEPMGVPAYPKREFVGVLDCDEDILFDDGLIPSFGPKTTGQALNNLQKAERQFAAGQWITGDAFFHRTRKMIEQYAS
jgi:hypothetical protein